MAHTQTPNYVNCTLPTTHFRDTYSNVEEKVFDTGYYRVNLSASGFNVYSVSTGSRIGGIGHNESFVEIGAISVGNGSLNPRASYIVFTGPDGQTPTLGLLNYNDVNISTPWNQRYFTTNNGSNWLKTYNRTIYFAGVACPPGTYVQSNCRTFALGSGTYLRDAGNLRITCVWTGSKKFNVDEACNAAVTQRGINCDVEGYWK